MDKYTNSTLKFGIQFPENWRLAYWKNRKRELNNSVRFQHSYDDLAIEESQEKEVFFAKGEIKGPSLLGRTIVSALFLRSSGYDINREFPENELISERKFGVERISGKSAQFMYMVEPSDKCVFYKKYYAFESIKNNWLCFAVVGDTEGSFQETNQVFKSIKWF